MWQKLLPNKPGRQLCPITVRVHAFIYGIVIDGVQPTLHSLRRDRSKQVSIHQLLALQILAATDGRVTLVSLEVPKY